MKLSHPYRISILGPQGSGKGTQAELLGLHLGLPQLSMGQMLRDAVASGGALGKRIDEIISVGHLVPSEISQKIFEARIAQSDCARGFIIDGFARTADQYEDYKKIGGPTHVIALELSDDAAVERLGGRLVCAQCGKIYHERWNPPTHAGMCDVCGGALVRRQDDTPEIIRERLALYHRETEPILQNYVQGGLLYRVDAVPTVPVVHAAVLKVFGEQPRA